MLIDSASPCTAALGRNYRHVCKNFSERPAIADYIRRVLPSRIEIEGHMHANIESLSRNQTSDLVIGKHWLRYLRRNWLMAIAVHVARVA